ncbi:hypothetical protein [Demequina sp. NBRC 110053]|uniref:hypothetical protein n=1 Tax=Demequina sp. NBRC 110053 TaxID=1570342 RepID=UPI001185CEEA|nr:hypothetical protein [Demequina sp. NBRC 110053]
MNWRPTKTVSWIWTARRSQKPRAEECDLLGVQDVALDGEVAVVLFFGAAVVAAAPPDDLLRGEEHGLGGLRGGGEPEVAAVTALAEPVGRGVLAVADALLREVGARKNLSGDDRIAPDSPPHDGVAALTQHIDEGAESRCREDSDLVHDTPPQSTLRRVRGAARVFVLG